MPELINIHWTENEELLEQFVLGRLGSTQATELELHLQVCNQCQAAVARERQLVAGIRLAGREPMMQRLAKRIDQRKARSVNWYRAVGVAAGIVLLVTVGIYYRWFAGAETKLEKQERADTIERSNQPSPAVPPQGELSNADKRPADAAHRTMRDAERNTQTLAAGASKAAVSESGHISEARVDRLRDSKDADAVKEGDRREKKDRIAPATVSPTIASTWIEGSVISEREQNVPAQMGIADYAKDERAALRKGKEESLQARRAFKAESAEMNVQNFIVNQRLLSDLPPSQRNQQQKSSSIQTLLQKNQAGTVITVYLDTLLAKKELDHTRVQTVGEDSIIINLGNRQVVYKLPPDWTGQGAQQTRKVK